MVRIQSNSLLPIILALSTLMAHDAARAATVSSISYVNGAETIIYSDGSKLTSNFIGSAISWGTDHITKTVTYSFKDGTTNRVTSTVPGRVGTPTYALDVETKVTTYGDGTSSTARLNARSATKSYNNGIESIVYKFDDATSNTVSNVANSSSVKWASDHITKTTTYTFADATTNSVVATLQPTPVVKWAADHITKTTTLTYGDGTSTSSTTTVLGTKGKASYSGGVETIVTSYGDGTVSTSTNTGTVTKVSWASDHITKTTTYTFPDATTSSAATTVQPTTVVKWADDHITKTTTLNYGDGTSTNSTTIVAGTKGKPTYSGGVETVVTSYGDGTVSTVTNNATATKVSWASDHITKTTTYTFPDATTRSAATTVQPTTVVSWADDHITKTTTLNYGDGTTTRSSTTVAGTKGLPTYVADVETISMTYGDGTVSTVTNNATTTKVSWASDHITKTTLYSFADATTSTSTETVLPTTVVTWASDHMTKTTTLSYGDGTVSPTTTTVQPTISTSPSLTSASYPGNWTTGGTVIPPRVSGIAATYADGYASISEDGSSAKPFNQTTLAPNGASAPKAITDPNAFVASSTQTYNLTWGTPDPNGPAYATLFPKSSNTLPTDFTWFGTALHGSNTSRGASLSQPNADVLAAWNQGWTGKGENLLVVDDVTGLNAGTSAHAFVTSFIAGYYTAHGANTYLLDYRLTGSVYGTNSASVATSSPPNSVHVINASYEIAPASSVAAPQVNFYNGTTQIAGLTVTDATIVMAAGNATAGATSGAATSLNGTRMAMVNDSSIGSRLILVGATNTSFLGFPQLASYSNYAGPDATVQSRFLVANGTVPWGYGATNIGNNFSSSVYGTSYAAPLVAGYAAIIRQKFPNITGANTADILLATARYDTLVCYPNCDPAMYGKGEASLSRALAPVGRLR